jgi:hypothetical protein
MSHRRVDASIATLSRVSDERLSRLAGTQASGDLLDEIIDTGIPRDPSPTKRRLRVPVIAGLSIATVGATAAFGWAITNSSSRDTVSVQCTIAGAASIIPATSGDPVTDCSAEWRRQTGAAPPALLAYDNGHGGITVAPATEPPGSGFTPLPPGASQNVSVIELQESLDDYVAGLNATCHDNASAVAKAQTVLSGLGLSGWSVTGPTENADGQTLCANRAIVDAATRTVVLRALGRIPNPDLAYMKLAVRLRAIAQTCQPLPETVKQVQAAAADLGLSEATREYQLTEISEPSQCTAIHETVGGTIFLTLRGPLH